MGKYRITGRLEWREEREFHCSMEIDETVEADSEEGALSRLRKTVILCADDEEEMYSSSPSFDRITKKLTFRVIEHPDPGVMEKQERMDNLAYMRQYSSALFPDYA